MEERRAVASRKGEGKESGEAAIDYRVVMGFAISEEQNFRVGNCFEKTGGLVPSGAGLGGRGDHLFCIDMRRKEARCHLMTVRRA